MCTRSDTRLETALFEFLFYRLNSGIDSFVGIGSRAPLYGINSLTRRTVLRIYSGYKEAGRGILPFF